VLWAEAERDEVREEAWQRRHAYAERLVARTSKNLVKPGLIRPGDLVLPGNCIAAHLRMFCSQLQLQAVHKGDLPGI
jgi:hypothetical protein